MSMGQVFLGIRQFPLSVLPSILHIHIHSSVTWVQKNGPINTTVPQRPSLVQIRINKIFSYLFVRPIEWVPGKSGKFFEMMWKYYATNCLLFCVCLTLLNVTFLEVKMLEILLYKTHECVNKLNFQI